jgi:hypothetical protein
MTEEIKQKIHYWLPIVASIILIVAAIFFFYKANVSNNKAPEIVTVPATDTKTLEQYFPEKSKSEIKDISRHIEKTSTLAPQYHYFTTTVGEADKMAQQYAKRDNADKIIKTSEQVEVKDDSDTSKDNSGALNNKSTIQENNYYAIQMERKHKIQLGVARIDDGNYASITYQNRQMSYTGYYDWENKRAGAGISYTVSKW